jgi:hypothetical protein
MGLLQLLNDKRFNMLFSFVVGVGVICLFRPACKGKECELNKPPTEKDFDKHVYRIGEKCYEFKTDIVKCPPSGAIEAFKEKGKGKEDFEGDIFRRRSTPISLCD